MIRNYFKVTYRNLIRQKTFAFINIFGLAIGLTCSILVGLYVNHEYSYDKFHKDTDRLYRVILDFKMGSNTLEGPLSPAPMGPAIMEQLPDVEAVLRLHRDWNRAIRTDNKTFYEDRFFHVDSNFFNFFTAEFVAGNPEKSLISPYTVVITDSISLKLFGTTQAVGKMFQITNEDSAVYEVTGVVKSFPSNSHFHFSILAAMSGHADSKVPFWLANNYYTYVKLKPGTNEKEFGKKLTELFIKNASPQIIKYFNFTADDFFKAGNKSNYGLQKVTDIHLKSNLNYEIEANGSNSYVSIFILIAIFVLLNACINFINLTTARSTNRAKEVGLRKVMGSNRKRLIFQFLTESIFISYVAIILALLMVELLLPHFNHLLNVRLNLTFTDYLKLFPFALAFATIIGFISGAYPAFYLSSFNPSEALKNKLLQGKNRIWLRNILVIVQFSVSVAILLGTMLVASQLHFMQNKKLGFDKERLLVIERTDPIKNSMKAFMEELQKCPAIENVSLSTSIPGIGSGDAGYTREGENSKQVYLLNRYAANYDFTNTLGIKIKSGRYFSREFPTDSAAVVINESTARYMGLKNPLGEEVWSSGQGPEDRRKYKIIGVMEDFHYESLHKPVDPMLLHLASEYFDGFVCIRFKDKRENDVLEFVHLTWKNFTQESNLQYFFFEDQFKNMYKKEIETRELMNAFAILAILIASLGLFGLIAYIAERRTKEIGIRKVLGSSEWAIVPLMTKEITLLVLGSYAIAAPLAYLWMNNWLTQFAFKTPVHASIFVIALVIAILIAWLTVSVIAIKAACRNPVESLRYE